MRFKIGLISYFVFCLFLVSEISYLFYQRPMVKPLPTTKINSYFCFPWSVSVTESSEEVRLEAVSINYFELIEFDSDNDFHRYKSKEYDGLFLVNIKVNLNSRYTSLSDKVYYSVDSSKNFTYCEKKFNPQKELLFIMVTNIILIVIFMIILARTRNK